MVKEHWKDPRFWIWYWNSRLPIEAKVIVGLALLAALGVSGFFASAKLTSASAATSRANSYVLETTVIRVVTVREHGKAVVRRVPVIVRRTIVRLKNAPPRTLVATDVVTRPGAVRLVTSTQKVVRYVPVVQRHVVRIKGKTTTITETRLVPTVKTQTLTSVVTNQQTVTTPPTTVVVPRTNTVVQTDEQTVTEPPETVTDTETRTQTETETTVDTETVTVTVTPDPVTVTVPGG